MASAATISLRATPATIGVGDEVLVTVLLDSAVPVNTFSGTVSYTQASLEPIALNDGNSIISLWITRPAISTAGATISFAGITPGGFSGDSGILFSILFRATATGTASISLEGVEILRNDGEGGKEPLIQKQLVLSVVPQSSGSYVEPSDTTAPEPFTAYLGADSQLFDGQSYLAFMAVDKGSGIDHYEIAESRLPSFLFQFLSPRWNETVSPYKVLDQNLTSTVYVRAVDRAGNERISVYPPQHLLRPYEKLLLGILLVVVLLFWRRWGRRFLQNA